MKKFLLTLIAVLVMAPTALASDFTSGVSPEGCYYVSDSHKLVYSRDASLMSDAEYCSTLKNMSSVWYINNVLGLRKATDAYWNRIQAMKVILKK